MKDSLPTKIWQAIERYEDICFKEIFMKQSSDGQKIKIKIEMYMSQ